jgi:pyruvate/2-oxoacid:ferredoxin oxidoreductase alpha subunit
MPKPDGLRMQGGEGYAAGSTERDYLVITLGPNPTKAVERLVKEKAKHGYKVIHISPMTLHPKMKDRPTDEIKFGKHERKECLSNRR